MDIKKTIEDAAKKITSDPALLKKFNSDPVKAVESIIGIDLPDDAINPVIDGIKAKLTADKAADLLGSVKKLF